MPPPSGEDINDRVYNGGKMFHFGGSYEDRDTQIHERQRASGEKRMTFHIVDGGVRDPWAVENI